MKRAPLIAFALAALAGCGKAGTTETAATTAPAATATAAPVTNTVEKLSLTLTCGGSTCIGTEGK